MNRIKNNPDPYFNVAEAAAYLGQTERWIRRSVEERRFRLTKLGGKLAFRRSWLDEYAESNVIEPGGLS
ncbi:MAG: helix-turn-helix domain-containing protein [Thermoleophilia bacterium]|nr:helix-turn-helix domain-containing protein [Thermoleophilia bacterium]